MTVTPASASFDQSDAVPIPPADDSADEPVRKGLIAIIAFAAVFLVGGMLIPLDAAVVGQGHIVVAGNRQSVQHRDGGIVSQLLVREGQRVTEGDVLLEIDATELKSRESVLARKSIALRMREARLDSEVKGARSFPRPEWIKQSPASEAAEAEAAYLMQSQEFRAGLGVLGTQNAVLTERIAQLRASLQGLEGETKSVVDQKALAQSQLEDIRGLYTRGYAALPRVRALESSVAELTGKLDSLEGQRKRDLSTISEFEEQRRDLNAKLRDTAAQELSDVQTELLTLEPQLAEVRAQIARAQVRATASGQVVSLSAFTEGGVVSPGQVLMEIVPDRANLVIDAVIRPQDARNIKVGQQAQVKFLIAHARRSPRLFGSVATISADQLVNDKSGQAFFKIQVELPPDEMMRATKAFGEAVEIGPGMPAEVVIPTRDRTALGYLLDPITDALWSGLREE
ncbi:MAG: HlyD family type I secretion periplasmic adaptor subunit [Hyphomonadaceae bacterium]